jgi:hypothetical protein
MVAGGFLHLRSRFKFEAKESLSMLTQFQAILGEFYRCFGNIVHFSVDRE